MAQSQVQSVLNHYGIYFELSPTKRDEWLYLCPFHDDHDVGSAMFNDFKNDYYCFSCGKGGDIHGFIMRLEQCSYNDAVTLLQNDFKKGNLYDVEVTKQLVNRKLAQGVSSLQYQELAQTSVDRLLNKCSSDIACLQVALVLSTWIMSFKAEDFNARYKQVIVLYDQFYSQYIQPNERKYPHDDTPS